MLADSGCLCHRAEGSLCLDELLRRLPVHVRDVDALPLTFDSVYGRQQTPESNAGGGSCAGNELLRDDDDDDDDEDRDGMNVDALIHEDEQDEDEDDGGAKVDDYLGEDEDEEDPDAEVVDVSVPSQSAQTAGESHTVEHQLAGAGFSGTQFNFDTALRGMLETFRGNRGRGTAAFISRDDYDRVVKDLEETVRAPTERDDKFARLQHQILGRLRSLGLENPDDDRLLVTYAKSLPAASYADVELPPDLGCFEAPDTNRNDTGVLPDERVQAENIPPTASQANTTSETGATGDETAMRTPGAPVVNVSGGVNNVVNVILGAQHGSTSNARGSFNMR